MKETSAQEIRRLAMQIADLASVADLTQIPPIWARLGEALLAPGTRRRLAENRKKRIRRQVREELSREAMVD